MKTHQWEIIKVLERMQEDLEENATKVIEELKRISVIKDAMFSSPWMVIASRLQVCVWEYMKVDVTTLKVYELTFHDFIELKQEIVIKSLNAQRMALPNMLRCLMDMVKSWVLEHEKNVKCLEKDVGDKADMLQKDEFKDNLCQVDGLDSNVETIKLTQKGLKDLEQELKNEKEKLEFCKTRLKEIHMYMPPCLWRIIVEQGIERSSFDHLELCNLSKVCKDLDEITKEEILWKKVTQSKYGLGDGSKALYKTRYHEQMMEYYDMKIKQCVHNNYYIQAEINEFEFIVEEYGEEHVIVESVMSRLNNKKILNNKRRNEFIKLLGEERVKLLKAHNELYEEKEAQKDKAQA